MPKPRPASGIRFELRHSIDQAVARRVAAADEKEEKRER